MRIGKSVTNLLVYHEIAISNIKYVINKHIIYYFKKGPKNFDHNANMMECNNMDILNINGKKQFNYKKKR